MKTKIKNLPDYLNIKKAHAVVFFLILALSAGACAEDGMLCGTVSDLEKIFSDNKTAPQDLPPFDYIISKAHYEGIVMPPEKGDFSEITAVYTIDILKDGWVMIPFFTSQGTSAGYSAGYAALDGESTSLKIMKDRYYLVVKDKRGIHKLTVNFKTIVYRERLKTAGTLFLPDFSDEPVSSASLTIEIPESGIDIDVSPSFSKNIEKQGNKTIVSASLTPAITTWYVSPAISNSKIKEPNISPLPSQQPGISLTWRKKGEQIEKPDEVPKAKLYGDVKSMISIGEGVMKCNSVIDYSIVGGSISMVGIEIPQYINILGITHDFGQVIGDFKIEENDNKNLLSIQLPGEVTGNYRIVINYEKSMGGISAVSEIPRIELLGVERERGHIGIEAVTTVEIKEQSLSGATRVDISELPKEIWSQSGNPLLFGYKYLEHPYSIVLDIEKHEDVPLLSATIDSADILTMVMDDGKTITKATYHVKNNRKQFLEIDLPKKSTVLSAFVSGVPVKVGINDEGMIMVPLSRSQGVDNAIYAFRVEVVYMSDIEMFSFFGGRDFEIPRVDIPVSRLNLVLYLPEDYDYLRVGGDLKKRDTGYGYGGSGGFASYERHDEANSYVPQATNVQQMEKAYSDEMEQAVEYSMEKGVLPVRIEVPTEGVIYQFTQTLVLGDKDLKVSTVYTSSGIMKAAGVLLFLFITAAGFYTARGIRDNKELLAGLRANKRKILLMFLLPSAVCLVLPLWGYAIFGWLIVVPALLLYILYLLVRGGFFKKK